jgi:hypothetical protein
MINKANTNEWHVGEAWMINAALVKNYRPDDIIAAAEARRRLNDVSMKKNEDPDILFEQLAEIEVACAGTTITITEQDCIGVVFATSSEKYHSVLTSEQRTKGADLTMDDLEDAMNRLWRQGGGSQKKHTSDDGGEMMFAAFGGTCCNCQEKGHRANQCIKKDGPINGNLNASGITRGKFKGECNNCGNIGYKKSDCWQLEENKNKRPKDYLRVNAEQSNAVISGGTSDDDLDAEFLMCDMCYGEEEGTNETGIIVLAIEHEYDEDEMFNFASENEEVDYEGSVMSFEDIDYPLPDEYLTEMAMCAMKFPNSIKLLLDPNVWIADTGATVHATPNSSVMVKKSDRNVNDSVTMGYGKSEATEWYGYLHVTLCDMEGNTKGDSKMTHVAYVPTSKFNLFSLTRMMINNWILGGDKNSIWLEKGRDKIVFDIKITTSTGAIDCAYMKRKFELTNLSNDGK